MAEIVVSDKEEIDFNYNLRVYFGFLAKYRWAALVLVGLAFLLSGLDLVQNYAFKLIIDNAALFIGRQMAPEPFQRFLTAVFAALLGVTAARVSGRWLYLRNINLLEADLIGDIKRFYFNHLLTLSHGFHTTPQDWLPDFPAFPGIRGRWKTMTDTIIFQYIPLLFQLGLAGASILYFTLPVGLVVFATSAAYIGYSLLMNERQRRGQRRFPTTTCPTWKKEISATCSPISSRSSISPRNGTCRTATHP